MEYIPFTAKPNWHCDKHNLTIAGGERCFMCYEEECKKRDIEYFKKWREEKLKTNPRMFNGGKKKV